MEFISLVFCYLFILNKYVNDSRQGKILKNAVSAKFKDFEDAVIHESAMHAGANYIVTRNITDFKKSKLPVFAPKEFINALESLNNNG